MLQPYHECPSFISCSSPLCPLDPDIISRVRYPDEPKCRAEKPTRFKIGSKYPELLPYQGLTKREWVGKNMPEEERKAIRDRLKPFMLQAKQKGKKTQKSRLLITILTFCLFSLIFTSAWAEQIKIDYSILAHLESSNNPKAISHKNCIGTYQISTAVLYEYNTFHTDSKNWAGYNRPLTQIDLFYYDTNFAVARWYLEERIPQMLKWYNKPITLENILWAYNAGIGNLTRGIKPQETKNYIKKYRELEKGR